MPFYNLYLNMENYAKNEYNKLKLLNNYYNNYIKLYKSYVIKRENSFSEKDKEKVRKLVKNPNVSEEFKWLKTLKSELILIINNLDRMSSYITFMDKFYELRKDKLFELVKWLNDNKGKAEESLKNQETIRAQKAKAITSALLIGLAGGLAAYSGYLSTRPQTQNLWLYDQRGNVYMGTIR